MFPKEFKEKAKIRRIMRGTLTERKLLRNNRALKDIYVASKSNAVLVSAS